MLRRSEESRLTSWYFEVDRKLLFAAVILMLVGMWAMVTAGSVAAERMNPPQLWHFFLLKMLPFYGMGLATMFVASALPRKLVMTVAWLNVAVCLALLATTFISPMVIKGSTRWVNVFGFSVMPADLMKPGFIIITAWFLDRMMRIAGPDGIFTSKRAWKLDGWPVYLIFFIPALVVIFRHPDIGTAFLYAAVFFAMLFMAGLPWFMIVGAGGLFGLMGVVAFMSSAHFKARILTWLGMGGDNYQIRKSVEAIRNGGLFGSGEDAFIKQSLPDAHTDFIYSAIVEDSGALLACALIIGLFYVLKRLAANAAAARDRFVFYAAGGVLALFGIQVSINLASALGVIPPKGMTLPFISYGGSSFLAFCLTFGLLLALIREDKWK